MPLQPLEAVRGGAKAAEGEEMHTSTFDVEGMTCEGCASAIRRAITAPGGIDRVDVDLDAKRVTVLYDEGKVSEQEIRERIEDAGYDVVG
jgi:copper chaperone